MIRIIAAPSINLWLCCGKLAAFEFLFHESTFLLIAYLFVVYAAPGYIMNYLSVFNIEYLL